MEWEGKGVSGSEILFAARMAGSEAPGSEHASPHTFWICGQRHRHRHSHPRAARPGQMMPIEKPLVSRWCLHISRTIFMTCFIDSKSGSAFYGNVQASSCPGEPCVDASAGDAAHKSKRCAARHGLSLALWSLPSLQKSKSQIQRLPSLPTTLAMMHLVHHS